MRFRTNHRPEMPHHLDIVELGDRRLGDILERLAGGIGYEVEVEAAHRGTMASARGKRKAETRRPPLWIRLGIRGWPNAAAKFLPRRCRFRSTPYPQPPDFIHRRGSRGTGPCTEARRVEQGGLRRGSYPGAPRQ